MKTENVLTKEIPTKYRQPVSLKAEDLENDINITIEKIDKFIKENNLTALRENNFYIGVGGNVSSDVMQEYKQSYQNDISKMTRSGKKRLVKRIRNINHRISIRSINKFLNFIKNKVKPSEYGFERIAPSVQEQEIINIRIIYKELKDKIEIARKDYRLKKKDYQGKRYFA